MIAVLRRGYNFVAARPAVRILIQALVSVTLIVILVIAARSTAVLDSVRGLEPSALLLGVGLTGVSCVLASARWQLLLHHVGVREGLASLTALYLIGQFFSLFLPTSAGGDAVRMYDVARRHHRPVQVIWATFQERLLGLGAGGLIGLGAALYYLRIIPPELAPWILLSQAAVVVGVGLVLYPALPAAVISATVQRFPGLKSAWRRWGAHGLSGRLRNGLRPVATLPPIPPLLLVSLVVLAGVAVLLNIATYYVIGRTLQIEVSFLAYCLVVPLVAIVRMFPLSLNGIGVGEGSFVFLLGMFGVPSGRGVALALVLLGLMTGVALMGGLVLAFRVALGTWGAGHSAGLGTAEAVAPADLLELPRHAVAAGEKGT